MHFLVVLIAAAAMSAGQSGPSLAGTWACQSMAAGAYTGRPCNLEPWLTLESAKTYVWGQEKGTWEEKGGQLKLSGRPGSGQLDENGKLVWEYDLRGRHYRLVLYRRKQ